MTVRAAALLLALLIGIAPANAQGQRGTPPGLLKKPTKPGNQETGISPGGAPTDSSTGVSGVTARSFGTWLDDATLAPQGSVWLTIAATAWSAPAGHGIDLPSFGVVAGLGSHVQLSVTAPYSRISTAGVDGSSTGLGTLYAGVKVQAAAPEDHRVGISFSPNLEVLTAIGSDRHVGLVLPVSIEGGADRTRVYGSAGYFSRGAVFASAAVERHLTAEVALTGALMQSWSTADAAATDALGLHGTRTDASGSITAFVTPSVAVFASVGRTLSALDFDGSRYVVSGGVALVFTPPPQVPIRPPR